LGPAGYSRTPPPRLPLPALPLSHLTLVLNGQNPRTINPFWFSLEGGSAVRFQLSARLSVAVPPDGYALWPAVAVNKYRARLRNGFPVSHGQSDVKEYGITGALRPPAAPVPTAIPPSKTQERRYQHAATGSIRCEPAKHTGAIHQIGIHNIRRKDPNVPETNWCSK